MKRIRWWHAGVSAWLLIGPVAAKGDGPGVAEQIKRVLADARVSLAQAVGTAQEAVPHGTVVDAELKWNHAPPHFEVELIADDKLKLARIDPATGKLHGLTDSKLDPAGAAAVADAAQKVAEAKLTVAQVIAAATKEAPDARPLAIALAGERGRPVYTVRLLLGDKLREARIDAVSGGVLAVEDQPLPLALWTFDAMDVGQLPPGLLARQTRPEGEPGKWRVAADTAAPSPPNVLQLTTSAPDATFNVALWEKTSYQDLDLRVRIRGNTGKEDQGGGLIWRARDENNYYICRINPLENNFRVYKVVKGKRSQLQSVEFKAESGKWYQLQAVMTGDHITCSVNGRKLLDVSDGTFPGAGMIGLWTKADASSSFDNLAVFAPPARAQENRGGD